MVSNDNGALDFTRLGENEVTQRGPMVIWAYDLTPEGTVGDRREFVNFAPFDSADGLIADMSRAMSMPPSAAPMRPASMSSTPKARNSPSSPQAIFCRPTWPSVAAQDANLLYVTAGGSLYQIRMNAEGFHLPSP